MFRAALTLLLNLFNFWRYMMRNVVKTVVDRFRPSARRFVKIKIPAGLALAGAANKLGPIPLGFEHEGDYWNFVKTLRRVAKDKEVEGVYFRADSTHMGLADLEAITLALGTLRKSGKRVVCHLEQAMLLDYLLATAADTVLMTPPGRLYTFGLRMDLTFLGDAFEMAGIRAQFINIGRYKTASHRFTRTESTPSQLLMMQQLMNGLSQSVIKRVASGRNIDMEVAGSIFDGAPISARDARNLGLIDVCAYRDQVVPTLEGETDDRRKVNLLGASDYMRSRIPFSWRPVFRKPPKIAVLSMTGIIMMGNEGLPKQFRKVITPKPFMSALRRLRKDDSVKAVVVHIDSPGGAALASDLIWRQVEKLAKKKPVIACLGNVAASGGYYIAVGATKIVALPDTLTGSIGVIAGKLSGGELLERLGVGIESISLGKTSGFTSLAKPLSEAEIKNLRHDIRAFYRRFLFRVAKGRGLESRRLHRLARGHVYTGTHALTLGLVDEIGDLERAIDLACEEAGVARKKAYIEFHDSREGGLKTLLKQVRPKETVLDALVPESLHDHVAAAMLLRTPAALTLWPWIGAARKGA